MRIQSRTYNAPSERSAHSAQRVNLDTRHMPYRPTPDIPDPLPRHFRGDRIASSCQEPHRMRCGHRRFVGSRLVAGAIDGSSEPGAGPGELAPRIASHEFLDQGHRIGMCCDLNESAGGICGHVRRRDVGPALRAVEHDQTQNYSANAHIHSDDV